MRRISQPFFATVFLSCFAYALGAETLTFGTISENPRQEILQYQRFIEVLEPRMQAVGIEAVNLAVFPNVNALSLALAAGDVDVFIDSPVVATQVAMQTDAVPLLLRWKDGVASYHSVIFTHISSPIESLEDLVGKRVGFEERSSSSGFMLPITLVLEAGLDPIQIENWSSAVPDDRVGYLFTEDDRNTMLWMIRARIDAAATDNQHFEQLDRAQPGQFRIIAQSAAVPRNLMLRSLTLSQPVVDHLSDVLQTLHEDKEGKVALEKFDNTTRFEALPEGNDALVDDLSAMLIMLQQRHVLE